MMTAILVIMILWVGLGMIPVFVSLWAGAEEEKTLGWFLVSTLLAHLALWAAVASFYSPLPLPAYKAPSEQPAPVEKVSK